MDKGTDAVDVSMLIANTSITVHGRADILCLLKHFCCSISMEVKIKCIFVSMLVYYGFMPYMDVFP